DSIGVVLKSVVQTSEYVTAARHYQFFDEFLELRLAHLKGSKAALNLIITKVIRDRSEREKQMACLSRFLNSANFSLSKPPKISKYSCESLNGASSKPTEPGEFESINPKSMSTI
ncbi:10926_t:CDS:2, partial [Acaulospora colombiana]